MAEAISKIIFELNANASGVFAELEKVATKYKETTVAVKSQNDEIKALQDKELGLLEIRKKTTNPTSIVQLTKAIQKNREEITKLSASQDKLNKDTKEYTNQLTGLPEKLNNAFNKQIVSTFEKQVAQVTEEQKKLNKNISDNKSINSIRGLTLEYKRLVSEAIKAGENTDVGLSFLKQAGEVKDHIQDIQQITARFGSDTAIFDGLIGATQGIASGFQIAQGAAALFGEENDEVQKALLKVNAAMAIANGLQQIQAVLQKESAFRVLITTGAMRAFKLVVGDSSTALKVFKLALAASGIGLAVIGIQKLVENWEKFRLSIFDTLIGFGNTGVALAVGVAKVDQALNEADDSVQKRIDRANQALHNIERNSTRQIELARAKNKSEEEIANIQNKKVIEQQKEIAKIQGFLVVNQSKLTSDQLKALADFGQDFADAKNQEFIIEAETIQRRIEERKKIAEAEKKLNDQIEDLQVTNTVDERKRSLAQIRLDTQRKIKEVEDSKASEETKSRDIIEIEREREKKISELEDIRLKRIEGDVKKELEIRSAPQLLDDPQIRRDQLAKRSADEREAARQRTQDQVEGINLVVQATARAAEQIIAIELQKQDQLIEIQNRRVAAAEKIAEKGNAEILQQEQERLDELQKRREAFVRQQQILQQVEILGNVAVAITKAASQTGVAAPIAIATTIAAIVGGLAAIAGIAQAAQGFKEGGYTGDGDPSQESRALGNRGYKYHRKEFIFNEGLTRENLSTFRKIHRGELDLGSTVEKARLFDSLPMPILNNLLLGSAMRQAQNNVDTSQIEGLLHRVEKTIRNKPNTTVNINENGFKKYMEHIIYEDNRINLKAR